jgi:superfamily I DNA/RNA helicase/RecB family exonuclease
MTIAGFRRVTASTPAIALDASQQAVLDLPETASAAVLGAGGSGKTTTIVELVADRILNRGWSSSEVVVLSPTRRSATRLRNVISARLGVPTNGPLARTATSLAFSITRELAVLNGVAEPRLLTGGEQDAILRQLLAGHEEDGGGPAWPERLPPSVRRLRGFRTELRDLFARAAESGLGPSALVDAGRRADRPEWVAAGEFLREYQTVVDAMREGYVDSTELVVAAAVAVRGSETPPARRLIVLDDAQEATAATLALLRAVAERGTAVIAVGDPDLAVGTFRGASVGALGALHTVLGVPVADPVILSTVHRQRPELREFARSLTGRIGSATAGTQRAAGSPPAAADPLRPFIRIEASSAADERARLARVLRERHVIDGIPWSSMAVVVRSRTHLEPLARALAAAEVPTHSPGGSRLVDVSAARHLVLAASVAIDPSRLDAPAAVELLSGPFGGLDRVALRRLRLSLRQDELANGGSRSSDELLLDALEGPGRLLTIDSRPARRASALADSLDQARRIAVDGTVEEVLWSIWDHAKLAHRWAGIALGRGVLAEQADRDLDAVLAVFTAARAFVERNEHASPLDFLDAIEVNELSVDTLSPEAIAPGVMVGTPAAVIGEQYDVVAVAGLQEGVWPDRRVRGQLLHSDELADAARGIAPPEVDLRTATLHDELRMFALAITRPSRQLILSAVANEDERPSALPRLLADVAPDPVSGAPLSLRGLVGDLRRRLVVESSTAAGTAAGTAEGIAAAGALARLRDAGAPGADPAVWYGLLERSTDAPVRDVDDPERPVTVSPTSIENIEKSALAWFVDSVSGGSSGLSASIGTIIHGVMERVSQEPDASLDPDSLWTEVEKDWGDLEFESPWIEDRERARATEAVRGLSAYLRRFVDGGGELLAAEDGFDVRIGSVRLKGKIDRVERGADGAISIVDLKTGRTTPVRKDLHKNAQLGSYQLGLVDGGLAELVGDSPVNGGARLLFVARPTAAAEFTEFDQDPFDEDALAAFRQRVLAVAEATIGPVYVGRIDLGERDPYNAWHFRIQLVPAVSA